MSLRGRIDRESAVKFKAHYYKSIFYDDIVENRFPVKIVYGAPRGYINIIMRSWDVSRVQSTKEASYGSERPAYAPVVVIALYAHLPALPPNIR